MKPLNHHVKTVNIFRICWKSIEKSRPELGPNEHVYAIFCRPEAAGDVISGRIVKIVEGYVLLNFETDSFSSFRENQNQPFV